MSARIDTVVDVETLRSPILTLPRDIDAAWFRNWLPISNRQIRLFHAKWGETIQPITGFAWPHERPGVDAVYDLLPEAACYPYFLRLFLQKIEPGPAERRAYFKRLSSRYVDALRANGLSEHESPRDMESTRQKLVELAEGGQGDIAIAVVLLEWSAQPIPDKPLSMFNVADALPGLRSYILSYLACSSDPFARLLAGDPFLVADTSMEKEKPVPDHAVCPVSEDAAQTSWKDAITAMARLLEAAGNIPPDASMVGALEEQLGILDEAVKQHAIYQAPLATKEIGGRAAGLLNEIKGALVELELLDDALSLLCDRIASRLQTLPPAVLREALDEAASILSAAEANGATVADNLASYRSPPKMPPKQFLTYAQGLLHAIETNARNTLEECDDALAALALPKKATAVDDHISVENVDDYIAVIEPRSATADETFFEDEEPFDIPLPPFTETEAANEPDAPHVDPFVADIHAKAAELFAHHEWGLSYHFARASERMLPPGDTPITADELKVIALAKEMTGSKYEPEGFKEALEACVVVAGKISESSTPFDRARQTALYAAMVPTALFNLSESSNAFSIIERLNGSGYCAAFFRLKEVLDENRKSNFPLSLQNIAAAGDAKADRSYVDECKRRVLAKIAAFQSSNFRFALGQKIKKELLSAQGEITLLANAIQSPAAADAANRFAEEFPDRHRVLLALDKIAEAVGYGQVIDGAARERLVALLLDLSSLCQDFSEAKRQATDLQAHAGRRSLVRRLIDDLATGIDHFMSHLDEDDSDRLLLAANSFAKDVLGRLSSILRGSTGREFDRTAANLALHVPLLWLPNMTWSHAWTPSPADSPKLVNAIIDLPLPRLSGPIDAGFRRVVEQRYQEDAFLAAKVLLQFWQHFGLSEAEYLDLEARVAATESVRRGQLAAQQDTVGTLLHKVRRMALGSLKGTADLEESLRTVSIGRAGDDFGWDFMPEEVDGVRITDVNAAFERLSDLERQARELLDEGKAALEEQISSLSETEVSEGERQALSKLLEADDLATLSDWLGMFASGVARRPVLESGAANKDLIRFRSIHRKIKGADLVQLGQMLTTGSDKDIYDISALDEDQREEAGEVLKSWQMFKRAMKSGLGGSQLTAPLLGLVSQLSFDCSLVEMNKAKTKKGHLLVIDASISMSFDGQSRILPDFGSMVGNSWQIAAATNTVSNSEIMALAEGAENRGTLVLFFGSMATDRREQLKLDCIRTRRKILVVDEVLLSTVLTMPERRRLAMFELAQASTVAKPYQDYGRSQVPPEMFKGRAKELAGIIDPFGSYIVYGGRRLGKTALLRHLARRAPPHAEFGYVDLTDASSKSLWEKAAGVLMPIFVGKRIVTADDFEQGVKDFLAGDARRRVLLMLDEADNFVRQEAQETDHRHVLRLIALMNETNHRFKFILSGLHNVSRITKAENSPLAQISSDPVRIGPLVNGDAGDAEALVRMPLAALGYEFANREDVWRILSFANYYPILIQVFCQGLLDNIEEHQKSTSKLLWSIPSTMVDRALADPRIRKTLYESFEKTIKHIEQRYELLTYIIAEHALIDVEEGIDGDGMTTSEVAERATKYWPEAFPKGSDPAETDYLLDEMEGFGILRRITGTTKWGLRSRMLLDLMVTDEEDLLARIYSFQGRKPEDHFDPKNARSSLPLSGPSDHELRISPLTDGQEAALLDPDVNPATAVVIFGPAIANVDQVHLALKRSSNPKVTVEVRGWRDCGDLLAEIKRVRQHAHLLVLIVPHTTEWTPDWVRNVAKQANVVRGRVRPVFVGTARHAAAWSRVYPWGTKAPHRIEIATLKPWSRSYIAARLDAMNGLKPKTIDRILELTGGWNDPCQAVFASAASGAAVDKMLQELGTQQSADISERFGMPNEFSAIFSTLADYCEGETADSVLSLFDDQELASTAIRFGLLTGILTTTAADPNSGASERLSMNGVARALIVRKR